MADEIELQAMNDHDLIVMSVMRGNETVRHLQKINLTIEKHEKRILTLETKQIVQNDSDHNPTKHAKLSKTQIIGIGSGLFMFASFIGGLLQGFGRSWGWW